MAIGLHHSYAALMLSNLPHTSKTPPAHADHKPIVNCKKKFEIPTIEVIRDNKNLLNKPVTYKTHGRALHSIKLFFEILKPLNVQTFEDQLIQQHWIGVM